MNRTLFITPLSIAIALALTANVRAQDRPTVDVAGGYAFSYITCAAFHDSSLTIPRSGARTTIRSPSGRAT